VLRPRLRLVIDAVGLSRGPALRPRPHPAGSSWAYLQLTRSFSTGATVSHPYDRGGLAAHLPSRSPSGRRARRDFLQPRRRLFGR